jgi:hypothetical protein
VKKKCPAAAIKGVLSSTPKPLTNHRGQERQSPNHPPSSTRGNECARLQLHDPTSIAGLDRLDRVDNDRIRKN